MKENSEEYEQQLSEREKNVVRYVAGYIPHAIEKHFKKCQSNEWTKDILELILLSSKKGASQALLEYTNTWIDCGNRGGLLRFRIKHFCFLEAWNILSAKFLM